MIKRNRKLLHLDLSCTNLSEYMLWHIGKALSRARSVIAVHLSGNYGVTERLVDLLRTRIRCKPKVPQSRIGLDIGIDKNNRLINT